jgi:hypothetical protein
MNAGLLPLSRFDFMMGHSAQLRVARCGVFLKNCTSRFNMTNSIMNRDGGNGIRANACCLRPSKSVSHQDQLFMLTADENCIRWKALYSFCSLSRSFLATLAMNFGHAITPGSIVLHLHNAIQCMTTLNPVLFQLRFDFL